ncbi:MAG: hypothetical protein GX247_01920 [Mollicutes bacterium]|nr:hypothetical protein [Mollicutes bacterium]
MSKIMVIPNSKEKIEELLNDSDAFLLGIKDLSVNLPIGFTLEELNPVIKLLNKHNKEIFIALNKNMHNSDLYYLKEVMHKLNDYAINGVFYYDIGIVNIYHEHKYNYDLVWAQEHLTTNHYTCNYWYDLGVKYALISGEITLEEIIEIKENTKMQLIVPIFGYLPMFVSRRHLIKNYLEYFNLKSDSTINYIVNEGNKYPIIDDNNGTSVYSAHILNGIEESLVLKKKKIEYLLLNSFNIDFDVFKKIVNIFKNINEDNKEEMINTFNKLIKEPMDKGFLYKATVYKVKNNE